MRCSVEPAHEPARGALPAWCVVSLLVLLVAFPLREGDTAARAMGGIGDLYCRSAPMTCTDAVGVNAPSFIPALIAVVAVMFSGACP